MGIVYRILCNKRLCEGSIGYQGIREDESSRIYHGALDDKGHEEEDS